MKKPNLLFVFSDQHRSCDLNCYGNIQIHSPNFDEFYKNATVFNNCISNVPVCVPMRGSLLTGLLPLKHYAVSNDLPIDPRLQSFGNVLQDEGYVTGYIGKWHLDGIPRDKAVLREYRMGFETWKVANCNHDYNNAYYYDEDNVKHLVDGYEPIAQTDLAIDYISNNSDNPWGLVLSYGPPHAPYDTAPKRYRDIYSDTDINFRDNVADKTMLSTEVNLNKDDIANQLKGYYAHISALDEQFGRLINVLKETGQLENTLIVYTSDHGDMLGSQGQSKKQWYYNESIKVPLMVSWQGHTINKVSDELIGLVDLPVSLLSLMGYSYKNKVDGQDLSGLFIQDDAKGLQSCYIMDLIACHQAYDRGSIEWRGIVTDRYTYAVSALDEAIALYDNIEDEYQLNNLIDDESMYNAKTELDILLKKYIDKHDKLLPMDEFVIEFGLTDEWNVSQKYFGYPIVTNKGE